MTRNGTFSDYSGANPKVFPPNGNNPRDDDPDWHEKGQRAKKMRRRPVPSGAGWCDPNG